MSLAAPALHKPRIKRQVVTLNKLSADGFVLEPQPCPQGKAPAFYGEVWKRSDLLLPKEPVIPAHVDPGPMNASLVDFDVQTFKVKEAGSHQVFVPRELGLFLPFIQKSLNNEFAANERAVNRHAVLILDSSRAKAGEPFRPNAARLHGHPPFRNVNASNFDYENRQRVENSHYYVTSSFNPTLFYTGAIKTEDVDAFGRYVISDGYVCDFQAQPGDISLFTSVHAHSTTHADGTLKHPRVFAGLFFEYADAGSEPVRINPMLEEIQIMRLRGQDDQLETTIRRWRDASPKLTP